MSAFNHGVSRDCRCVGSEELNDLGAIENLAVRRGSSENLTSGKLIKTVLTKYL